MNTDFIEILTNDDLFISLRTKWDPNETYWISTRRCNDAVEVDLFGIECQFLEINNNETLVFVDGYGIKHEINPKIERCRENVIIYSLIGDFPHGELIEEKWFDIKTIPFDKKFFKIGHCYMVKENRTEDHKPMMLIEMNFEQMHFVCVDTERFKNPGIKHVYVKAERYSRMKKGYWFKALMEGDVWSNDVHKEMAEVKEE